MKKLKIFSAVLLLSLSLAQVSAAAANEQEEISLFLNGSYLACEVVPIIEQGEILIPLRSLGEAMNVGIYWDEQTKTASIKSSGWRGERELKFQSDSNTAAINGEKITLAVPVQIVNGRTMVPASAIAEGLDLAVTWDEKTQSLSLQERYRSQNGAAEIVLTPIKPDKDSSYMIYHGMQAEINGEKYEYAWEWNAGIGQYIAYNPPEIFWADLNADGREEIIIRLVDGINTGTGVSWEKVYVLKPNGAEIAVQDAREYALRLAEKKEGYSVGEWASYEVTDGELTAGVTVFENGEQKAWRLRYIYTGDKLEIDLDQGKVVNKTKVD